LYRRCDDVSFRNFQDFSTFHGSNGIELYSSRYFPDAQFIITSPSGLTGSFAILRMTDAMTNWILRSGRSTRASSPHVCGWARLGDALALAHQFCRLTAASDAKDPLAYSRGFSQTNFIAHHSPKTLFEIGDGPFLRGLSRVPHIVRLQSISRSATPATCFSSVHMLSMTSFIFVAIPEDFPYVVRFATRPVCAAAAVTLNLRRHGRQ